MEGYRKKIAVIGIGNAGGQVGKMCSDKYADLMDVVYINSSDSDLAMVGNSEFKFKIGEGVMEGSGKNRTRTKKYLKEDAYLILNNVKFQNLIKEKRYVFIVSSTAGGTGSGAAPMMMDVMREAFPDVNFILVGILPHLHASLLEQANAREYCDELYRNLDDCTYMMYDNETTANLSPIQSLIAVNEAIVEDIRIVSGIDSFPTPYESIDEADMESIVSTPGRLMIVRVTKGLTEKIMEDTPIDDIIIKAAKTSKHAETNRDKKVFRYGLITYFTEAVNRRYESNLEKVMEFLGTPIERFNHNAVNEHSETMNFLYFMASGLSPINDRIRKMDDRVDELHQAMRESRPGDYIESDEDENYSVMSEREKDIRTQESKPINIKDIMNKY